MLFIVWFLKINVSNNATLEADEVDVSITGAEERIQTVGAKESVLVQTPSGLLQTSMRSGSPQPLKTPPPSPREPVRSDTAGCPASDVTKSRQPPAEVLASHFTGEAWFQEVIADYVCTVCISESVNTAITTTITAAAAAANTITNTTTTN